MFDFDRIVNFASVIGKKEQSLPQTNVSKDIVHDCILGNVNI